MNEELGKKIVGEFQQMKGLRANWEWHWQEVADLVLPTRDFTVERHPGDKRRNKVYDSTPVESCTQLAAAMHGLMTNPSTRWLSVTTGLGADRDYGLTTDTLAYLGSEASGASTALHEVYQDLAAFGTGCLCMHTKPIEGRPVRFSAVPLNGIYASENDEGEIVCVIRHFKLTDADMVARFGADSVPKDVLDRIKDGKSRPDQKDEIIHKVAMRDYYDPQKRDSVNKPWGSWYVHVKTGSVLREGGFDDNPYLLVRWAKAAGEVYGRGPGMDMLPDIKTLNVVMRTVLIAGEMATLPPLAIPANGFDGPIRTAPGSLNYMRAGMRDKPEPIFTGADPRMGADLISLIRERIEKAFFLDLFRLPELDRMTATEVIERRQQRLQLMSPVLARCYSELLRPMVVATVRLRHGIEGQVEFVSPMSVSQKASEINGFMQLLQLMTPLLSIDPNVAVSLDADYAFRKYGQTLNVDPKVVRSKRAVEEILQKMQQQQQMQSMAEGAKAIRDTAAASKDFAASRGGLNVVA